MEPVKYYQDKKKAIESKFVLAFIMIGISFIVFIFSPFSVITFIGGGLWTVLLGKQFKKLSTDYKTTYIRTILKQYGDSFRYVANSGIDKNYIYNHRLLKREDRFHSEDMILGNILGYEFITSDVHLEDVRSNGKSTTVVTVFQGRVYKIEMHKTLANPVYVMPRHYNNLKFKEGLEHIDVESILFNQKFDVYARNEHDAFYLITPRMIEKIMAFSQKARRIMISYQDDTLMLAFDTRTDNFDIKPFKPISQNFKVEIDSEMNMIEEIIEQLSK